MTSRRSNLPGARFQPVLCRVAVGLLLLSAIRAGAQDAALWQTYKARFIREDGRVVDDGNGGVSHSEGQGYGLLLAEANGDRETFERLWKWTAANLQKRPDRLFAWRWKPDGSGGGRIDDPNNATDGDLLIAWALCRAAATWQQTAWRDAAAEVGREIRKKLVRPSRFGPVLLPGIQGFEKPEGVTVNLSYWVFPALAALARVDPDAEWQMLANSGLKLVEAARFGPCELPPDWLTIGPHSIKIATGFDPVYGYNAVRIPLYLAWAGVRGASYYQPFRQIGRVNADEIPPATVFLPSGKFGPDPALPGMRAIYQMISGEGDFQPAAAPAPYTEVSPTEPYFSVSLGLLTNRASYDARTMRP